ncbi:hypothetical protein HMPREF9056_02427 [Actinomyces sp. oral taxon 170 str. F0386]|nr:hypothetical protein HMPREF9056_02427 [Actinomyces sp. oral taxon 170 str. F0386]
MPERVPGTHPIYQVTCELQLSGWLPVELPGCTVTYDLLSHGTARYDVSVSCAGLPRRHICRTGTQHRSLDTTDRFGADCVCHESAAPGGRITGEALVPTRRNDAVTLRGVIPPSVSPSPNHAPLQAAQLHPPAPWTAAPAHLETG